MKKILIPSAILVALTIGGFTMAARPTQPIKHDAQPTTASQALPSITTIPSAGNRATAAPTTAEPSASASSVAGSTANTSTPVGSSTTQPTPIEVAPTGTPLEPAPAANGDTSSVSAPAFSIVSQRPAGTNNK